MGGVTAATMRSKGAAPEWAARYRVLSLVLAALLGQGCTLSLGGGDAATPFRTKHTTILDTLSAPSQVVCFCAYCRTTAVGMA
ncbi:hypothetical protein STEG23_021247 [Scotinomys teguina]